MPEITPQTFQDEQIMQKFIQDNYGLTDYSRGSPGRLSDNRTATGLVTLVQQAQGRLTTESFLLEKLGLANELQLLLAYGAKFITDAQDIRVKKKDGGSRWMSVESKAISESFTVHLHGTKYMQEKDQAFQKQMQIYPLWNQDPSVNQPLLKKELGQVSSAYQNLDELLVDANAQQLALAQEAGLGTQGAASAPRDVNNPAARREQRTTVTAGGGQQPANQAA